MSESKKADESKSKQSTDKSKESSKEKAAPVPAPPPTVQSEIDFCVHQCERSAKSKESRLIARAWRKTAAFRRKLTAGILHEALNKYLLDATGRQQLIELLPVDQADMHVDPTPVTSAVSSTPTPETPKVATPISESVSAETEVYLHLLVVLFLIDGKNIDSARRAAESLIAKLTTSAFNRRTLDLLASKAYFYYARTFEVAKRFGDIRNTLLAAYRTSTLRHDNETQAVLLNLLLRCYLADNLYDQADKLVAKTSFNESACSGNQYARYLFYTGRIRAIQLDYTEAYNSLLQASRKAPQKTARGFRCTVTKLACIVQLLLGEIPEKAIFRQADLQVALRPYFLLTQAVSVGDLAAFHDVVKQHEATFVHDRNFTLIQRLRRNVIKTGLRKINSAYSRISLADIATKLHFDSVADVEYIVAKAIRDEIIDATIDHRGGFIQSRQLADVYSTHEPQEAFHKRIDFCQNLHNEAVKAIRFPFDPKKSMASEEEEERKEILKAEKEIEKSLAEDDDDF